MSKIIVTGGAGYIGSHTTVELQNNGYQVIIIDNLSNSRIEVLDNIETISGIRPAFEEVDLRDEDATKDVLHKHKDAIGIIHFAALKAVGESVAQPIKYYQNNMGSLLNVLASMKKESISSLIFSSSATVYGQPDELPATEETPWKPAESPYGATKQMGEIIVKDATKAEGNTLKAISLRYFNPIGAHKTALIGELPIGVPKNLMPFVTQTAAGIREELKVFGSDYNTPDGTAIRDYIHVVDLAKAHVIALERLIKDQQIEAYEVFNLGTGNGFSVLEVIHSFERSTGEKLNYSLTDRRPGDVESVYASTTKANKVLGWKAELTLDEMTKSHWDWEKNVRGLK